MLHMFIAVLVYSATLSVSQAVELRMAGSLESNTYGKDLEKGSCVLIEVLF
jgi:hypothetical protein